MWLKGLLILPFLGLCLSATLPKEAEVRYDGYKVYEVKLGNQQQYELLSQLKRQSTLDFWNEAKQFGDDCDIMVAPQEQTNFETELTKAGFQFSVKISNVQSHIEASRPKRRSNGLEWTAYHTLDEINDWLDLIIKRYPSIITPFTIGHSYEGREIRGIKISYKKGNKAIFIEANIHGREWISSATVTYVIDELLVSRNPSVRDIAENLDWYIIPVLNVDGFVYSHESRRSRLPSDPTGNCIGTDLNRNFDYLWMFEGASSDPCAENYAGPFAKSDIEIRHLTKYIDDNIPGDTIKIYLSLHSYGQYVLLPWGHTEEELPEHYPQMMAVAKGYSEALKRRYGTVVTYGSRSTMLYKVSGSGKDWAYGVKGIPIPFTIELRDKGDYGYILPPEQIIPVGREVLDGFVGMVTAARGINVL